MQWFWFCKAKESLGTYKSSGTLCCNKQHGIYRQLKKGRKLLRDACVYSKEFLNEFSFKVILCTYWCLFPELLMSQKNSVK